jgi:hypothetical protein
MPYCHTYGMNTEYLRWEMPRDEFEELCSYLEERREMDVE